MAIEQVILSQSEKVARTLEKLRASRKYQNDKLIHGLNRVDLYVEDVEGDFIDRMPIAAFVRQIG